MGIVFSNGMEFGNLDDAGFYTDKTVDNPFNKQPPNTVNMRTTCDCGFPIHLILPVNGDWIIRCPYCDKELLDVIN
jgi:hypothetical protein